MSSKDIREGLALLTRGLEEPTFFIDLGQVPFETDHDGDLTDPTTKALCRDQDIPADVERTFRQVWYPSAAPLLIGPMVPGELRDWSLKMRLAIYGLVVAELEREEVCELLGCSAWYVRRCIEVAVEEFEQEITHAHT